MRHGLSGWWLVGVAMLVAVSAPQAAVAEDAHGAAPSPKAQEALRLVESKDAYQQQVGFLRLEALREPATAPLLRPYVTSKYPELRASSLRALAAIEGAASAPLLLERLKTEKHAKVRRAAILGLEPFAQSDPNILPALIRALRDSNTQVRMTAVDVVSRIKDPRAREAIAARHKREHRRDVRRVLKQAMKRMGS